MTYASDDLVQLFDQPDQEHVGFAQGVLRAWNPDTFENVVEVRGGTLTNLPVAAGVEALTYQAGDVVMLSKWKLRNGRGIAQYWIGMGGKVLFPAAGRAAQSVAFLQTSLARQISSEIFAERVHGDTIPDSDLIGTAVYDDLTTVGPTAPQVKVEAGTMIVFVSGSLLVAANAGDNFSAAAYMGYDIDGPTPVAPSDERAARLTLITTSEPGQITTRPGGAFVHTGLQPGTYTVQAKYRVEAGDENQASANDRTLVAIGI